MLYNAVGNFVIIQIPNPISKTRIVTMNKEAVTYNPNGIVCSVGMAANLVVGNIVGCRVQYIGQMMRHTFGDADKDEFLYVVVPSEAILAVERQETLVK